MGRHDHTVVNIYTQIDNNDTALIVLAVRNQHVLSPQHRFEEASSILKDMTIARSLYKSHAIQPSSTPY